MQRYTHQSPPVGKQRCLVIQSLCFHCEYATINNPCVSLECLDAHASESEVSENRERVCDS